MKLDLENSSKDIGVEKMKPTCVVSPQPAVSATRCLTGLDNLGNTCFMNSVIQILANTTPFKDYFMGSEFQQDINQDNPLGSGGKLAIQFAKLTRILWDGSRTSHSPSQLKRLVSEKASQFTGFAQHDAQEFLGYLLDGLHEDLNRVKNKPYTENTCLDHLPDHEAAEEAWRRYKARNDSLIVDNFQGQFRSKLVCPVCNKVSVTFDPFMYVSVPIPKKKAELSLTFFPKNGSGAPRKITLNVPKSCMMRDVAAELSDITGVRPSSRFQFMQVDGRKPELLPFGMGSYKLNDSASLHAFEVDTSSLAGEEIVNFCCMQRTAMTVSECSHCKKVTSTLKRCSKCRCAAYCGRECQAAAWPTHRLTCKSRVYTYLGHPFVVSLPKSRLTYRALTSAMESAARHSVNLFKPPVQTLACGLDNHKAITGDANQHVETTNNASPLFLVRPVDGNGCDFVDGKATIHLKDLGEEIVDVSSKYLVMEWKSDMDEIAISNKDLESEADESGIKAKYPSNTSGTDLEQCLDLFTKRETLSPEEAWYCPTCKTHREAEKQIYLWSLPDILIIQLKRFSFRNALWRDKIDENVTYPINGLDARRLYVGPSTQHLPLYDLYGVVNHHGNLLGGHYTAYARCLDRYDSTKTETGWRLMDDSHVHPIKDERCVVNKAAYILFYKKRTQPATIRVPEIMSPRRPASKREIFGFEQSNGVLDNEELVEHINGVSDKEMMVEDTNGVSDDEMVEHANGVSDVEMIEHTNGVSNKEMMVEHTNGVSDKEMIVEHTNGVSDDEMVEHMNGLSDGERLVEPSVDVEADKDVTEINGTYQPPVIDLDLGYTDMDAVD